MLLGNGIKFFLKWARLKLRGAKVLRTGGCLQCGSCCEEIYILSSGKKISSLKAFERLKEENPLYRRFEIVGEPEEDGALKFTCKCLGEDGSCGDYDNRPQICRQYPHIDLYYRGVSLSSACGFNLEVGRPFCHFLEEELLR